MFDNLDISDSYWNSVYVANDDSIIWLSNTRVRNYNVSDEGAIALRGLGNTFYASNVYVNTAEGNGEDALNAAEGVWYGTVNGTVYP